MKRKMITSIAAMALLLVGLATVAFAAGNWRMPARAVSGVTSTTVGQSQPDRLAQCKQWLDEAVKSGQMTQADADKLYETMKDRMAACLGAIDNAGNANGFGYGMMGRGIMGRGMMGGSTWNGSCGRVNGQGQNIN